MIFQLLFFFCHFLLEQIISNLISIVSSPNPNGPSISIFFPHPLKIYTISMRGLQILTPNSKLLINVCGCIYICFLLFFTFCARARVRGWGHLGIPYHHLVPLLLKTPVLKFSYRRYYQLSVFVVVVGTAACVLVHSHLIWTQVGDLIENN